MDKIKTFITDRLKERSTWLGFTGLLTAVGVTLEPSQIEAITVAGVAVAALIATFTKDK
jgi:hypothetical protein